MKIKRNEEIKLKLPEFEVDEPLTPHLDEIPLLSLLNKSFACAFFGKAGSGKTSLMTGLLQTKKKFKKVFNKIYLFMPESSRGSMKKCVFDCLPEDQIYNALTLDNLLDVEAKCVENKKDGLLSLIIFDDVQDKFKGECEELICKLINNRRHMRTSLMFIGQSYMKMSRDVRKVLTNMFVFNLSKEDYKDIYDEHIHIGKRDFATILKIYRKTDRDKKGKNFLFIDPASQRFFINWDEVILDDDFDDDIELEINNNKEYKK